MIASCIGNGGSYQTEAAEIIQSSSDTTSECEVFQELLTPTSGVPDPQGTDELSNSHGVCKIDVGSLSWSSQCCKPGATGVTFSGVVFSIVL